MNSPIDFKLDEEFRLRNRPHTKQERLELERLIEEEGCAEGALTVALIGTEKILIDGYNTLAICQEKGIVPTEPRCRPFQDRQAVLEWIDRRQRGRRNLTAEQMIESRAERGARVVQERAKGKSIRTIAAEERVHEKTIRDDLADAGGDPSPLGAKVTGKDGRTYDARKPPPICDRCRRIAGKAIPGCPRCAALLTKPKALAGDDVMIRCPQCGFEGHFKAAASRVIRASRVSLPGARADERDPAPHSDPMNS